MMKTFDGLAYQPERGLQLLEIQQKVLRFLVEYCYAILDDIDPKCMIEDTPIKPEPPPLADGSEYPSLAIITADSTYHLPARVEFFSLKALIVAKRANAANS